MCGWTFIGRHRPTASGYKKLLCRRNMKKKYLISCGSTSWVGRIQWQWKYRRHCVVDMLLFLSIPARLLFSLCSPLVPFSAHLNAWNKPVRAMKILHWVIEDDKKGLQIILGQRYSINRISRFFPKPSTFLGCLCCTDKYAWYMAARALVLSSRSVWCHSNHVKAPARDATIIVRFASTRSSGTQVLYKYETFRFFLPACNLRDCFFKSAFALTQFHSNSGSQRDAHECMN